MHDGIYLMNFSGLMGWSMGMLVLKDGQVNGADVGGALYEGSYRVTVDALELSLTLIVPPGAVLVQGTQAVAFEQRIPFTARVPFVAIIESKYVTVHLPPGPVNVIIKRLKAL
jgi:hypothetical protein